MVPAIDHGPEVGALLGWHSWMRQLLGRNKYFFVFTAPSMAVHAVTLPVQI